MGKTTSGRSGSLCRLLVIFMILAALVFAVFSIKERDMRGFAAVMKKDWNVNLPEEASLRYAHIASKGFHGDRRQYAVLQLENALSEFEVKNDYQAGKNADIESDIQNELKGMNIPETEFPRFSQQYYWLSIDHPGKYGDDILYVLYFPKTKECYYVEKIIGSS